MHLTGYLGWSAVAKKQVVIELFAHNSKHDIHRDWAIDLTWTLTFGKFN